MALWVYIQFPGVTIDSMPFHFQQCSDLDSNLHGHLTSKDVICFIFFKLHQGMGTRNYPYLEVLKPTSVNLKTAHITYLERECMALQIQSI